MPTILAILMKNLGAFFWKLLFSLLSEYMIEKVFFKLARYLASKTDTPIDDEFIDTLEKAFKGEK
ncbi:hypothetical protein BM892_002853 [Escherichia coli]|nr:hypothetical protein [Escherichia coli]